MSLSRYQLERTDLITTIEQGRRVEQEQYQENQRNPLSTLTTLLEQRRFGGRRSILREQRRHEYEKQKRDEEDLRGSIVRHGLMCPCDDCDEAVKRLLRDCGVLPRGRG
ncbi:MAG TPA: hypothetical protein VJW23_08740 [Propionibacteriaceae bacterium]|nr:hypothetical protein [Propionibacteriaceae bacterium]